MPPLLRAVDGFLNYRKGPLALYALGEYIGQDRVRDALRSLLEKHGARQRRCRPHSISIASCKAVTPDSSHWLLHDLFEKNTFWELETGARGGADRSWHVAGDARRGGAQVVIDEAGVETELPMDDWVEIGVFAGDEPIYLQKHRIRSGKQTITVTVPCSPTRAGIDPRFLLIDWATSNNVEKVTVKN